MEKGRWIISTVAEGCRSLDFDYLHIGYGKNQPRVINTH